MRTPAQARPLAVIAGLSLALVACGGPSATPTPAPTPTPVAALVVETTEFAFAPDALTIPAGTDTVIRLVNKGIVEHDLVIDALEFQVAVAIGATAEGTLMVPEPGTYDVYCSLPGHKENGMVGTLTVE